MTNWPAYEAGLRVRGSLTVWFTAEAIKAWRAERRTTRGGQPRYSALAITTALTLRTVFHLALRQTEGLIPSPIDPNLSAAEAVQVQPAPASTGPLYCIGFDQRDLVLWPASSTCLASTSPYPTTAR